MNASSSLSQAAIILKSLPKRQAASILSRLEAADIQTVLDAIKNLDQVTADQIMESLERLHQESRRWKTEPAEKLVVDQLLDAANLGANFVGEAPPAGINDTDHPFGFLVDAIPPVRDHLLEDEHPQNIAIVLSTFPPEMASTTMKSLDPVTRVSVLKRLCELDELDQAAVAQLSYALKLRYRKLMNKQQYKKPGMQSAVAMLSCSDPQTQETMFALLNQSDPDLAENLLRRVIKLEDLAALKATEIKAVLRNVDTSCWAPALKKAPLAIQKKFLDNMGQRPAELLSQEMANIGDVDESMSHLARKQIINVALKLQREGKIKLLKPAGKQIGLPATGDAFSYSSPTTSAMS
jgi:flagellar motor switch protein FliG